MHKAQINLTDQESRIMLGADGFVQAYNAQAAVDCGSMLIVANDVSRNATDRWLLKPMLDQLCSLEIGKPAELIADAGYYSELNVVRCENAGVTPYIPIERQAHQWGLRRWRVPKAPPAHAPALKQMMYRLRTNEGRAIYGLRKTTSEPVFGLMKRVMGFRQFLLRRQSKVRTEWDLACIAWNLIRLRTLRPA